jgi:hypothetical protein
MKAHSGERVWKAAIASRDEGQEEAVAAFTGLTRSPESTPSARVAILR